MSTTQDDLAALQKVQARQSSLTPTSAAAGITARSQRSGGGQAGGGGGGYVSPLTETDYGDRTHHPSPEVVTATDATGLWVMELEIQAIASISMTDAVGSALVLQLAEPE